MSSFEEKINKIFEQGLPTHGLKTIILKVYAESQREEKQKLQKELTLFEVDLNSRISTLKNAEIDNPNLVKNFWFRQQRDTLLELVERKNRLEELFVEGEDKK